MRYARDTIILKTRSEVKVTVTQKWYVTPCHTKMYLHTKIRVPTGLEIFVWAYSSCGASGLNFSLVLTPVELVLKSGFKNIFQQEFNS